MSGPHDHQHLDSEPIAIVGYAYRAPGLGRSGLWEYLAEANSAFSPVPPDRFQHDGYYHPNSEKPGCISSKGGHFLPDDIYAFDAPFFNMTADEALSMDPQHRLLLECAFEASENAGWKLSDIAGSRIGVFAANEKSEYGQRLVDDLPTISKYTATGTASCMFANRLSYFFDLHGPSVAVDAACSSSSYALHLACKSIRSRECNAAFVGGASLIVSPNMWVLLDTMGALSPDGKSFSYDRKANGFGRGEGGACLVVKRLSDAIAANDPIRAVIRNTASNHSGRTIGISTPSQQAQEELLARVHQEIGLPPNETTFIEVHPPATDFDPIDAGAIANIVARTRPPSQPVFIGSLKSNFGHLEGASGVLSVVKAVMLIERQFLLPNAWFEELHPKIREYEKLRVPQTVTPWPVGMKRRVCVTNFGFGGSNAAALLEDFEGCIPTDGHNATGEVLDGHVTNVTCSNGPEPTKPTADLTAEKTRLADGIHAHPSRLFVFSSRTELTLASYLTSFHDYLQTVLPLPDLHDLSYTLGQRRTYFPNRVSIAARSVTDLREQLANSRALKAEKARDHKIAFVFTGQGAQYPRMGVELSRHPIFYQTLQEADVCLTEFGALWSLIDELAKGESETRIHDTEVSQPACTAIQIGLVHLLRQWGIRPAAVVGHSSGEIAAAYTAGFITFKAAMAISYHRGQAAARIHQEHPDQGAMLALGIGAEGAVALIESASQSTGGAAAVLAAVNSPQSVTVSGNVQAIAAVERVAQEQGLFVRRLKVAVAYHSQYMEAVAASYSAAITAYSPSTSHSTVALISTVTGVQQHAETFSASYWVRNLVQPVQFLAAINTLLSTLGSSSNTPTVLVEIGPHAALKGPISQILQSPSNQIPGTIPKPTYVSALVRGSSPDRTVVELAGRLLVLGCSVDIAQVNGTNDKNAHVVTNLPLYAWDRTIRYQHTSPVATQKAHPGQAYDHLLGWKCPSVGNEQVFRQVFTLDEMPFLRDHNIAGEVLFPFTGYLSLGIAAVRALTSSDTPPRSVVAKELYVKRGLPIKEEQRVDIATKLRPAETGIEVASSSVWAFDVVSWSTGIGWTIHCSGQIEASTQPTACTSWTMRQTEQALTDPRLREADAEQEYKLLDQTGVRYGPQFRTMRRLWATTGLVVHETELRDMPEFMQDTSPITVDAPTLDSFLHSIGSIQGAGVARRVFVPTYFKHIRVSNEVPARQNQRFTIVTRLQELDLRTGTMRVMVSVFTKPQAPNETRIPILEIESFTLKSITEPNAEKLLRQLPKGFIERLVPSAAFLAEDDVVRLVGEQPFGQEDIDHRQQLNEVGAYFMACAILTLSKDQQDRLPPHLASFVLWAQALVAQPSTQEMLKSRDPGSLVREVRNANAKGEMLVAIGEQLPAILNLELEPLEIMLKDGLLSRNYEQDTSAVRCNAALARYARVLSDSNPNLRVLEIGAGTGSATLGILESMSHELQDTPSFQSYTFTDISPGFFENAKVKLARWSNWIRYEKLDIGEDPLSQGFESETYDLVVASNVLHATADMNKTICNVCTLLKPGGKLLLMENVAHQPCNMPYALLPGWWVAHDEYRAGSGPLLSDGSWERLLSNNGFSGIDGSIADYPGTAVHLMKALWATKVQTLARNSDADDHFEVAITGQLIGNETLELIEALVEQADQSMNGATLYTMMSELQDPDKSLCIFIDSPQASVLQDVSEPDFESLKGLLTDVKALVWVILEKARPEAYTIKGLLRTLRLEDASRSLLLVENVPSTTDGATAVMSLAHRLASTQDHKRSLMDQDFVWDNEKLLVPRLTPSVAARNTLASESGLMVKEKQPMWNESKDAFEMTVDVAGSPDSIYFRRSDTLQITGDNEVIVRVEAVGVNFRDLLLVLGSMPWSGPGLEGAGRVHAVAPQVKNLKVGDRVFYISSENGYANYVRLPFTSIHRIPDHISAVDAATMPIAYSTARVCFQRARLQKGDTVLIHAASGAVGQACVTMAQHLGASRVFVTAGTAEKRAFLGDKFSIPKDDIFSSRTANFKDGILSATNGKGVDVIINSLSGRLLQDTFALTADFGRFIEIGRKDFLQNSHLAMRAFDHNVTFGGVDLYKLFTRKPEVLQDCLAEISQLLLTGGIGPIRPVTEISVTNLSTALRRLQSGQNMGKIVTTMDQDAMVLAQVASGLLPRRQLLHPDGTYLITGGTGGIGRALASWMVDNGARNVVLLGRSGSSHPEVARLLGQIRSSSPNVCIRAIACDVGVRGDVETAMAAVSDLPRVKGVVHGALFLRGAWNLHDILPKDLDFFISLASIDGAIGHVGQAIYAGTSTFLDAFSQYRNSLGLPAVSIGLPVVEGIGYVADRDIGDALKQSIGLTLAETHVYTAVKGAIVGPSSGLCANARSLVATSSPVINTNGSLLPWERFDMLAALRTAPLSQGDSPSTTPTHSDQSTLLVKMSNSGDAMQTLLIALMDKVASMTMTDRDEVRPDRGLVDYGLDSLVSVELRNWIRRETGVELALTAIVGAENLRALAERTLAQMKVQ
ncbi:hypothetical protein M409DRAFT_65790 [Zasmidium cellare ATCC 36951]|uniref:Uncharacterized protein n=1 Tax=Zasmidium cellare ATCC 36951 TaxID=1080233 RepID=A0A6A6CND6_ZASCE|nr:uncharacterized protein M409DRAFT_65790 [Zasmidium cellare ATCC 36951]KAF2167650.1 hypothetical protein M409DRAFT_65790 [Zasmidium cellare ATCC 36951]